MMRAFVWMSRHLSCCGCGCGVVIGAAGLVGTAGGLVTWGVVT